MIRLNPRRVLANVAIAVAVGTATVPGVALAGSEGAGPAKPASTTGRTVAAGINSAAHRTLEGLVSDGTITQAQADAVQAQVEGGSVNPKTLVESGRSATHRCTRSRTSSIRSSARSAARGLM